MATVPFPRDTPEFRRARLARTLRRYRRRAGYPDVVSSARALGWSDQKAGRQERGMTKPSAEDIHTIAATYRLDDDELLDLLDQLAAVDSHGWWKAYRDDALVGGTSLSYEDAATRMQVFSRGVFPALLQREPYVRGLLARPLGSLTPAQTEQVLQVRMTRRLVLSRDPVPTFHAIIEESVLWRPVGGRQVMADQLAGLLDVTEQDNVTLQIVPLSQAGAVAAVDEAFSLLGFEDSPPVVVTDGLQHSIVSAEDAAVDLYTVAWDRVTEAALSPEDSSAVLDTMVKEYR